MLYPTRTWTVSDFLTIQTRTRLGFRTEKPGFMNRNMGKEFQSPETQLYNPQIPLLFSTEKGGKERLILWLTLCWCPKFLLNFIVELIMSIRTPTTELVNPKDYEVGVLSVPRIPRGTSPVSTEKSTWSTSSPQDVWVLDPSLGVLSRWSSTTRSERDRYECLDSWGIR